MNVKLKISLPKDNNVSRKQTTEPRRYNDQTIVVVFCLFVGTSVACRPITSLLFLIAFLSFFLLFFFFFFFVVVHRSSSKP